MESITLEKPTLRMINSKESRTIAEWEEMYPGLWLLIEVTREDFSQVFEGRLIATAEDSVELIEPRRRLRSRGIVNLMTKASLPEINRRSLLSCNVSNLAEIRSWKCSGY